MHDLLWRTLLLENEGARLDFKQQQYQFVQAGESEKSELLKDLLAFANAWRTETAYILLGVGAGPAGERALLGLNPGDHVDDAIFQQFVNSKINRELTFSYRPYSSDGKTFGVFEIPVQERPFFSTRKYGRVAKHVVYFRRGSSTAKATPEQVAQMGRDDAGAKQADQPSLFVSFADLDNRERLGEEVGLQTRWHANHDPKGLPDMEDTPSSSMFGMFTPQIYNARSAFWRELADCVRDWRRFANVGLAIRNDSAVSANDVRVVLTAECEGVEIREGSDMPDYPESHFSHLDPSRFIPDRFLPATRPGLPTVDRQAGQWEVTIEVDRIRPQETLWVPEPILSSVDESRTVEIRCAVFAANLKEPASSSLRLVMKVEGLAALEIDELEEIHDRRTLGEARREGLIDDTDDNQDGDE